MRRRNFMIKAGQMMTVSMFMSAAVDSSILAASNPKLQKPERWKKRPKPNDFDQPILKAIALGINAPSPHNTQSWKFKIVDELEMLLYVDENRLLPATDPPSRQIHMGAGCFIETLVIGASSLGYQTQVDYFPEGYYDASDFGQKPVAFIRIEEGGAKDPLADYIYKRQTNRKAYTAEKISQATFENVKITAGKSHSRLLFKNEDLTALKNIFYQGLDIESRTYRTNEETRLLFSFSEKQRAEKRYGLSMPQMGYEGLSKTIVELAVDNGNPKKWHDPKTIDKSMKSIKKAIDSTQGVVCWISPSNDFQDWLASGRDFVRFSLSLSKHEMYSHPYNQVIQEFDEMKKLSKELDQIWDVQAGEKIQMMVRIGKCKAPYYSYRLHLQNYLIA
ncbi:Acg family FMN-binding oxidoreductase [Echinicola shivajiensis]|uniref:Acg family FMN-binding oxidoreductase n=1 Tax=Echinicola shivajiensis TaxID=1035916 RepID=UPI001BFC84E1|nr:hypothetical protein [Echinicola shivajiensis]